MAIAYWWKSDGNHPFMTAYALWGLEEARRAGIKVDTGRIAGGSQELAHLYAQYPRVEPDLKAYEAYVLQRIAGNERQIVRRLDLKFYQLATLLVRQQSRG